jgi:peptidoglycan/LPS O-acetylase OafA/YrhL
LTIQHASENRLANLDLLRLSAAVMVLLFHLTYSGHATGSWNPVAYPELAPVTQHMWAGVSLFFMISGFVIAYSAQRGTAYDFAVSRFARLYPGFLVCMTLSAAVMALAGPGKIPEFQMTAMRWAANLTMMPQFLGQPFVDGVYWSIVVEIIFYAWVGLLVATGVFQKHQLRILAVWLAISFLNEFVVGSLALNRIVGTRYACFFILGVLSYRVFAENRKPVLAEWALFVGALVLSIQCDFHYIVWMKAHYATSPAFSPAFALAKTLIFLALLNGAVRLAPLIRPSWCYALGGITYPLYLLHSNISFVALQRMDGTVNRWVALAGLCAVMVALSYGVFRYVEAPGRRLIVKQLTNLKIRIAQARGAGAVTASR